MTADFPALDMPLFSQREAAQISTVDNITIDNWVRHGHVTPHREGERRLFSIWHLVTIDLIAVLAKQFGLKPKDGSQLAAQIIQDYSAAGVSARDVVDIVAGRDWRGPYWGYRPDPYAFTRGEEGDLRPIAEGDDEINSVGVVVPTQLVARRVFAAVADALAHVPAHREA